MQERLLEEIRTHRKEYEAEILACIQDNVYQNERYKVNFSLAIGATPSSKVDVQIFAHLIRKTDKFFILGKHISCAVFSFVDSEQGLKAASNLLSQFEVKFFAEEIYLSILNVEDCTNVEKRVNELFSILEFAISNKMNNIPLDEISFGEH